MIHNQRIFDKIYTVPFAVPANGAINTNTKYYFTGYPFLRDIKAKAIQINNVSSVIKFNSYLSLSDIKGNYVFYNFPFNDLYLQDEFPSAKLRLCNINGVDLLNTYWLFSGGSFTTTPNTTLFTLSFYY